MSGGLEAAADLAQRHWRRAVDNLWREVLYARRKRLADRERERSRPGAGSGRCAGSFTKPFRNTTVWSSTARRSPSRLRQPAGFGGFLISLLGGSRVQIGGPTGAFVVIVYGIVQRHGIDGLAICTLMAGVLLIGMGLARFGGAIKFIPYPVVTGFTSGIAVIIFSSEVKDLLGLKMGAVPAPFLEKWAALARALGSASPAAVGLSAGSLAVLALWSKVSRRIPAPIVAILLGTAGALLFHLPVETIGSRFGTFRAALPSVRMPAISLDRLRELFSPAITVALLCGIESLLSAVVADGMIGSRHKSNVELVGQGCANIASALFGGIPATGAIARTATNIKNGGRTPVAGMTHAVTVLLVLLFLGRWVSLVPLAARSWLSSRIT